MTAPSLVPSPSFPHHPILPTPTTEAALLPQKQCQHPDPQRSCQHPNSQSILPVEASCSTRCHASNQISRGHTSAQNTRELLTRSNPDLNLGGNFLLNQKPLQKKSREETNQGTNHPSKTDKLRKLAPIITPNPDP